MSLKVELTLEEGMMTFSHSGESNYETSLVLWSKIAQACQKHQCFDVLVVSDTDMPMSTMDAFDHQKIFRKVGITNKHRIAFVDRHPHGQQMIRFIETVLKNRGLLNGHVFTDIPAARRWLLEHRDKAQQPRYSGVNPGDSVILKYSSEPAVN